MNDRIAFLSAAVVLCGLAVLSNMYPLVNLVMTVLVIAVFIIGAVVATVYLVKLNSTTREPNLTPVPPEPVGKR